MLFALSEIVITGTHADDKKKSEISKVVKEAHKLKITEVAHISKADTSILEPYEITQKLRMIITKLQMIKEELSTKMKGKEAGKIKGVGQDEFYQKLKLNLEKLDQELQEIFLPISNISDRVVELTEETLQVLQNKEGRPKEELKQDLQKVQWKLHIMRHQYQPKMWVFFLELRYICTTVKGLHVQASLVNLPVREDLEKLCTKIEADLTVLEPTSFGHIASASYELLMEASDALMVNYNNIISYSTGPGIYGSKRTESEGEAQGQGLFMLS